MAVAKGDKIKVQYVGKLKDGTVFDKSEENQPLEFTVGEGKIIPDFERAVEGMNVGENKTVDIQSQRAYGERDESLVRKFDRSALPPGFEPKKGMIIELHLPTGDAIPATISDVGGNYVVVDLNHPLAGKDLEFDIKVVGVDKGVAV